MKSKLKSLVDIFIETGKHFADDKATRLAASLAYYSLFSLAPLLIILTGIAGRFVGEAVTTETIPELAESIVGPDAANWLLGLVDGVTVFSGPTSFTIATIISVVVMFWSAANIFNHIKETLNFIWGVRTLPGRIGVIATIRSRVIAFSTVVVFGLLIVGFFLMNTVVAYIIPRLESFFLGSSFLRDLFPQAVETVSQTILPAWRVVQFAQYILAFVLMMIVFALFYKFMPDVHIAWRDVWVGAGFTALLITIGTFGLSVYFQLSSIGSLYGAAGTIMVILFYFYYSAQMFLFGAEFTKVYATHYGSEIRPSNHAISFEMVLNNEGDEENQISSKIMGEENGRGKEGKELESGSVAKS